MQVRDRENVVQRREVLPDAQRIVKIDQGLERRPSVRLPGEVGVNTSQSRCRSRNDLLDAVAQLILQEEDEAGAATGRGIRVDIVGGGIDEIRAPRVVQPFVDDVKSREHSLADAGGREELRREKSGQRFAHAAFVLAGKMRISEPLLSLRCHVHLGHFADQEVPQETCRRHRSGHEGHRRMEPEPQCNVGWVHPTRAARVAGYLDTDGKGELEVHAGEPAGYQRQIALAVIEQTQRAV